MTPIAHELALDSTLPIVQRRHGTGYRDVGLFDDLHFFDVSKVFQAATEMRDSITKSLKAGFSRLAFLPAPRTWLEFTQSGSTLSKRMAFLLEQSPDGNSASIRSVFQDFDGTIRLSEVQAAIPLNDAADGFYDYRPSGFHDCSRSLLDSNVVPTIYALLAMINTPRVINRRQHVPHVGLQRRLASARGTVGRFPLRAWTEITLQVRPPQDASGTAAKAAYLTGEKALHFCRTHLRIRLGSLELVTAHWRGNGALGIKQTRYSVIPSKNGRPLPPHLAA